MRVSPEERVSESAVYVFAENDAEAYWMKKVFGENGKGEYVLSDYNLSQAHLTFYPQARQEGE